jgi:hypothetical protein
MAMARCDLPVPVPPTRTTLRLIALPPSSNGKERAMQKRRRFKQTRSFLDRLNDFIADARTHALPEGGNQAEMLKKARQAKAAADIERWTNSPELQPPKRS